MKGSARRRQGLRERGSKQRAERAAPTEEWVVRMVPGDTDGVWRGRERAREGGVGVSRPSGCSHKGPARLGPPGSAFEVTAPFSAPGHTLFPSPD